jgi:secondary thiamine-phosphate synthase enzyme
LSADGPALPGFIHGFHRSRGLPRQHPGLRLSEGGFRAGRTEGGHVVATVEGEVKTRGQGDARDLTPEVRAALAGAGLRTGIVTVFVTGSTAGVTTIEFESGVVSDLDAALERLVPRRAEYRHHLRWGDDNGSSHVRAGIVGPSLTVPVGDGQLLLGTWQQIVLLEFDTSARTRRYIIQMVGE